MSSYRHSAFLFARAGIISMVFLVGILMLIPVPARAALGQLCGVVLNRNLSLGSRGYDVTQLQDFLINKSFLTRDNRSGYFGRLTQAAVQKYQSAHGIVLSGSPATTGHGVVGRKTRAFLADCSNDAQWRAEKYTPPSPSQKLDSISQTHNAFGLQMLKLLAPEEAGKNIFVSPSSIALALSMVYNGANADTKSAMQSTLQLQGFDISSVNQSNKNLIDVLKNPDEGVQLAIANSVWADKKGNFKQDFLQTVTDYYKAKISTLDFQSPSAAGTINAWASENTNGKIPVIVNPPIPPDMVMYLINAVYFKGNWKTPFDKAQTQEKLFTSSDGTSKKQPLMQRSAFLPYLETADFQSVRLTYGKKERLSMYVFLPKNIDTFVASLNADTWNTWMKQYAGTQGTILLPKFKIDYAKELNGVLKAMGMNVAFSDDADFSSMGTGSGGAPLKISTVLHKTYVDVNEEGTEAAAVTAVGMISITSVMMPSKTFYMEVNKPFFFAIRDDETGEVLFEGIIRSL